jgi:hypothetical protein
LKVKEVGKENEKIDGGRREKVSAVISWKIVNVMGENCTVMK